MSIADQKVLEEAGKARAEVNAPGKKGKGKPFPGGKKRKSDHRSAPSSAIKKKFNEEGAASTSNKAETIPKKIPAIGPAPKPNPYGLWKAVEAK